MHLQGVNAYDNDLDVMRAPHPPQDPRVLFCGEHLSKAYFQCVDGAFDTGEPYLDLFCLSDERI